MQGVECNVTHTATCVAAVSGAGTVSLAWTLGLAAVVMALGVAM